MARTVAFGNFEWNPEKAWLNLAKHKVSFEEAATVFDDPFFFAFKYFSSTLWKKIAMLSLAFPKGIAF